MVTLPADTFARVTALQGTAEFLDVLAVVVDHELARIRAHARLFDDRMPASAIADSEAWTYPEVLLNLIRAQADIVMKAVETADLHSRDAA
ncbi:hypothetical protein FHS97_002552 [Sphingomonas endophytica]|uniref:Uncharacterized protein n=2 Tax=Sphingomonas endophytica TaxID=869719 RepID=A0ABR6N7V0_9SPHN|nr:hypothetical protein [Sphingomonas endophytica]